MSSDHCPITFNFDLNEKKIIGNNNEVRLNFTKAVWDQYRAILEEAVKKTPDSLMGSFNINELNELISNQLLEAAKKVFQSLLKGVIIAFPMN